jgi:hypothetical protein
MEKKLELFFTISSIVLIVLSVGFVAYGIVESDLIAVLTDE